ncbi:MAG TPA: protein translocase subunit SecF [Marmoricola sp.]|jgi:preprotein translocase subunit SecF|nr:protein translocase subunit SecF [Marmoricola sp.]
MGRYSRLGNSLYDGRTSINFVGRIALWYAISAVIIVVAACGLFFKGLNLGIEFEGGVEYTVTVPHSDVTQANVDKIREAVAATGIAEAATPTVTTSGSGAIRVETEAMSNDDADKVVNAIAQAANVDANKDISPTEVGASWGSQVRDAAIRGLVVFIVLVVLFIWAYFREWKMSVGAMVALAHDLIITVGVYALSGFEVTPATVTGVLTILGFSLYDTVVVFDKVRENTKDVRQSRKTYAELANLAINQTLVRSINTSIVALLPVGALLYVGVAQLGSGPLKDLALALFVGMAAGTYSSIFIATPLVAQLKSREKHITEQDARARARAKRDADRYANVPVFTDDMPIEAEPGYRPGNRDTDDGPAPQAPYRTPTRPQATGSGRTAPTPKAPVEQSGSAKRNQPSRQPRSKRGK